MIEVKGSDVKLAAEVYLNTDDLEDSHVLLFINEALDLIGDLALHVQEVTFTTTSANQWCDLPEDTTSIQSVTNSSGKIVDDYKVQGMKVQFADPGVYTMVVRRMVPKVNNLNEPIVIHPLFNAAIISYVRGMLKKRDHDESQDGNSLVGQFWQECAKAHGILLKIRSRGV